jgi:serine/threonine-protein kinase RsbT
MRVSDELRVPIVNEVDVVEARRSGRALAAELGFGLSDQALIATAISELARNILLYARRGELIIAAAHNGTDNGISVVAVDQGPGIADPERAMQDGFSTGSGLGLGLPGTRRIMDEFELDTAVGRGTRVAVKKWVP